MVGWFSPPFPVDLRIFDVVRWFPPSWIFTFSTRLWNTLPSLFFVRDLHRLLDWCVFFVIQNDRGRLQLLLSQ